MSEPSPYRDERASLVEENRRLRAEVDGLRGRRRTALATVAAGAAVLGLDAAALWALPELLNARDDGRVYGGALLALVVLVANVGFVVRAVRARSEDG